MPSNSVQMGSPELATLEENCFISLHHPKSTASFSLEVLSQAHYMPVYLVRRWSLVDQQPLASD